MAVPVRQRCQNRHANGIRRARQYLYAGAHMGTRYPQWLFDHFVGAQQQFLRNRKTGRLRCLHNENEVDLRWPFDRQTTVVAPPREAPLHHRRLSFHITELSHTRRDCGHSIGRNGPHAQKADAPDLRLRLCERRRRREYARSECEDDLTARTHSFNRVARSSADNGTTYMVQSTPCACLRTANLPLRE